MEKIKAYVQRSNEGKLESSQYAIEQARESKEALNSLKGDINQLLPEQSAMSTEMIEITEETSQSKKGLLALLADHCPALAKAFAKNNRLAFYAYGHIFHALEEQGVDANALPIVPEKPVQFYMENGHIRMNVPSLTGTEGEALYNSVEFDLFPWGQANTVEDKPAPSIERQRNVFQLSDIPTIEESAQKTNELLESYGIPYQRRVEGEIIYTKMKDREGKSFEGSYQSWLNNEDYKSNIDNLYPELKSMDPEDRQSWYERIDRKDEYESVKFFMDEYNRDDRLSSNRE